MKVSKDLDDIASDHWGCRTPSGDGYIFPPQMVDRAKKAIEDKFSHLRIVQSNNTLHIFEGPTNAADKSTA
jgi:hypothetical protein